jgi:RimJ/RimL family protein N-acetyltransferase
MMMRLTMRRGVPDLHVYLKFQGPKYFTQAFMLAALALVMKMLFDHKLRSLRA